MKKLLLTATLLLSVLFIAGCDQAQLVPITGTDPQVTTIYVDGRQAALSTLSDTMVAISGAETESQLFLHIGYNNQSQRLIQVNPADISVQGVDRHGNVTDLKVYRAEEYLDRVRDERAAALFFRALGTLGHGHATVETRTHYHRGRGYSYYWSSSTYDHHSPFEDLFQLAEDARDARRDLRLLERSLLKRTTIMPSQNLEGLVVVQYDPRHESRFIVTVPFDIYLHRAEFVVD